MVVVVQNLVEHVAKARLRLLLSKVDQLLTQWTLPTVITDVHFIIATDLGVRSHYMAEQAGIGAHMAEKKDMLAR